MTHSEGGVDTEGETRRVRRGEIEQDIDNCKDVATTESRTALIDVNNKLSGPHAAEYYFRAGKQKRSEKEREKSEKIKVKRGEERKWSTDFLLLGTTEDRSSLREAKPGRPEGHPEER